MSEKVCIHKVGRLWYVVVKRRGKIVRTISRHGYRDCAIRAAQRVRDKQAVEKLLSEVT